ncbi:MAG: DPP IV N-terminal domain-containing protein [Armatimonadetes bacterium]|nr:DPP IV N-terminal domain-containing protein [Armatimonadota bacterium]MDE2205783.1 DPP IV N-terminal domain-containing protein [Armatimonadota bacterium]
MKSTTPRRATLLTLEDLFLKRRFDTATIKSPCWISGGAKFSYLDAAPGSTVQTVWVYDVEKRAAEVLIAPEALNVPGKTDPAAEQPLTISGYIWSPDESAILFCDPPRAHAVEPGSECLWVYTLATGRLTAVGETRTRKRNVKWSPDGSRIGYVKRDEIWVLNLATGSEQQLTDTATTRRYNGRFGWVVEEELGLVDGWIWSPDSRSIAYWSVDESAVPEIGITDYESRLLEPVRMLYPKAGDPNPLMRIGVVSVPRGRHKSVPKTRWVPESRDAEYYVTHLQYAPDGSLLLSRVPRRQSRYELFRVRSGRMHPERVIVERDDAWVEGHGQITFVGDSNRFLWLSERAGYQHLSLRSLSGKRERWLTGGDWDVVRVLAVDATEKRAWILAASPSPMERQIYCIPLKHGDMWRISEGAGVHSALFAPNCEHYIGAHSSRKQPPMERLHRSNGEELAVLKQNSPPAIRGFRPAQWRFLAIPTRDGITLNAVILQPADFDPGRRYPVLMHTYGGPGSQVVMDAWGGGAGFEQMLAQKGIISVLVDGRGSGGRGREFMKVVAGRLGHFEVIDQIAAAQWLAEQPFVDGGRIGIWGWSYGGYMASQCILRGSGTFRCSIAVAPVTDWKLYDSIYTERYMKVPDENPDGYETTACMPLAEKLAGEFLLIHGMADDNVHFQNTACLAAALQRAGKPFETMFYPGKHHGIEGMSMHLYALMTRFIERTLLGA